MTAEIIQFPKQSYAMACNGCDSELFLLRSDGNIVCGGCEGAINARWTKAMSNSPQTDELPELSE